MASSLNIHLSQLKSYNTPANTLTEVNTNTPNPCLPTSSLTSALYSAKLNLPSLNNLNLLPKDNLNSPLLPQLSNRSLSARDHYQPSQFPPTHSNPHHYDPHAHAHSYNHQASQEQRLESSKYKASKMTRQGSGSGELEEFPTPKKVFSYVTTEKTPLTSPRVKTLTDIREIRSASTPSLLLLDHSRIGDHHGWSDSKIVEEYSRENTPSMVSHYGGFHLPPKVFSGKRVLLELKVIANVVEFLGISDVLALKSLTWEYRNDRAYKKVFEGRLSKLIANGLNDKDQYAFWNYMVDFKRVKNEHGFAFTSQFVKDCPHLKNINKDLDRTLPEFDKYSTQAGKDSLRKVLVAISNVVEEIGYIQGLNAIPGVFLFYLNEEDSFWITLCMMERLGVKKIFCEDFRLVNVLNLQLKVFASFYMPDVFDYMEQAPGQLSYFTTSWFITMFSYFLSLPNILKAWNFFFLKGMSFFIQLALAVFSRYKHEILRLDYDDLGNFFKYELRNFSENDHLLFEESVKFELPERILQEIETCYDKKQTDLRLVIDKTKFQLINDSPLATSPNEEVISKRKKSDLDSSKESSFPLSRGKDLFNSFLNKVSEISGSFKARLVSQPNETSEDQKQEITERSSSWESNEYKSTARSQEKASKIDNIIKAHFEENPRSNPSLTVPVNREVKNPALSGFHPIETTWRSEDIAEAKTPTIHDDSPVKKLNLQSRDRLGSGDKFSQC